MDYAIIKILCDEQRIPIKELASKCGITEAGLHQMLRNQSMKIEVLEKIAEVLNVPAGFFFKSPTAEVQQAGPIAAEQVQSIMALNMVPEEKIKLLGEMVDLLRLTTEAQQKVIAAHEAEIQRLKAALGPG